MKSGGLLEAGLLRGEGPVEPMRQRFEVGGLDRRPGPDTQARRRVAVGADIEGHAFLLQRRDHGLGEGGLRVRRQPGHFRIGDGEADGGVGARFRLRGEIGDPRRPFGEGVQHREIAVGAGDQPVQSADGLRQRSASR